MPAGKPNDPSTPTPPEQPSSGTLSPEVAAILAEFRAQNAEHAAQMKALRGEFADLMAENERLQAQVEAQARAAATPAGPAMPSAWELAAREARSHSDEILAAMRANHDQPREGAEQDWLDGGVAFGIAGLYIRTPSGRILMLHGHWSDLDALAA